MKGTVTVGNSTTVNADANNTNKKVTFKTCALFTDCIGKINNTQVYKAKDLHTVMPMYDLMEYSDNYSKTYGTYGVIVDLDSNNNTDSFKFKEKITVQTGDDGTKNAEIMVPFKYLTKFWRTLEMSSINSEINLMLSWSANCSISSNAVNQATKFATTDTNLYFQL